MLVYMIPYYLCTNFLMMWCAVRSIEEFMRIYRVLYKLDVIQKLSFRCSKKYIPYDWRILSSWRIIFLCMRFIKPARSSQKRKQLSRVHKLAFFINSILIFKRIVNFPRLDAKNYLITLGSKHQYFVRIVEHILRIKSSRWNFTM